MNVFDFDETIYRGDTGRNFYRYILRKHPRLWWRVPKGLAVAAGFAVKILSSAQFKDGFYPTFFPYIDVERESKEFWELQKRQGRIKQWYLDMKQSSDVITTASPECLVRPIVEELGVKLIGAEVDMATGRLVGRNNKDSEKVKNFRAVYPKAAIDEFYSDSRSDDPMAELAKRAFIVRGDRILPWPKN